MEFSFPKQIGNRIITIKFEADTPADFFEQIAFYDSLPERSPKGATDLRFVVRHPKDKSGNPVTYYSIISEKDGLELKIGQHRNNPKSLFVKGEWVKLGSGRDVGDDDPGDLAESPERQSTISQEQNSTEISVRPLSDQQLDGLARQFVESGAISRLADAYVIRVNPKISYRVTKGNDKHAACECERFRNQSNPAFRCEHIRAVVIWAKQPPKPRPQDELKLLIAEMLEAGFTDDQIDGFIARVCDGVFAVEDLKSGQIAKAIHSLNQKLEECRLNSRVGAS